MKNDREPRAGRESGWHGFAQQVLVELHAIAADIWLQDRTSLAFHRIVAIGVSPADLFQRQSTQQYLLKLLTETTGLVAARTVLVPGLMDSAEAESLVILVPISHETVLLGVLVVVPQAGLEAPELARQLDWLTEKCIALGIRLGSVLRNPPQPVESSVATPDTESTQIGRAHV